MNNAKHILEILNNGIHIKSHNNHGIHILPYINMALCKVSQNYTKTIPLIHYSIYYKLYSIIKVIFNIGPREKD
jgi:hypothetical protein